MQYAYLWEFEVHAAKRAEFLAHYGPGGSWVTLFRRAPGYLGTQLLIDQANPTRFVTVDRWRSVEDFHAFKEHFRSDYETLDRQCEGLTEREASLGSYLVCQDAAV